MKILILGGNGYLGPWAVKAMKDRHDILLTDINEPSADYKGDYQKLSVDDIDGVVKAAEDMDMIINMSVLRPHRKLAFDVNTMGNYAMMVAARENRIKRVITTGPHYQMAGQQYEEWDYDLNPDMPPAPGTRLYAHTKALGQEVCRVFSERHGIQVLTLLYYNMRHSWDLSGPGGGDPVHHEDMTPYTTEWEDCGTAIRAAVEVPEERLASRCETFFILSDIPHRKFTNEKTKRVLGWEPRYHVEADWNKEFRTPRDSSHGAF
jgi:nucleoside-diphosphate-sugar epimerase